MSEYKRQGSDISLIQLSSYVKPEVKELIGRKWVLNGDHNSFFNYVIDRYNGSPTNESIINVYCELLYGKGIAINEQDEIYEELAEIFPKREQQKCISDYKMFGQYDMQILRAKGGGVAKILHLPTNKLGMDKMNDKGDIEGVWYCEDWKNTVKNKPEFYPAFNGKMSEAIMVKSVRPYQAGKDYFSDPDYIAALQYAELEEEISNYSVNHIKNGLSFGYIINFNNGGALEDEQKDKIERTIREKLTGTTNAGKFILSFNDGKDAEVTVVPLEVNDAHSQWEFLSKESMTKIMVAHGVTSPLLFGLPSASGFGANADELDVASKLLQDYQISPKQSVFIDELAPILELAGLETDLVFIPLRDTYKSTEAEEENPEDNSVDEEDTTEDKEEGTDVKMSSHTAEFLIELGGDIDDSWEVIDERRCDKISLKEKDLNTIFQFSNDIPIDKGSKSEQDTSLFKIRYRYAGSQDTERDFCQRVMDAKKYYKVEDFQIASEQGVNGGFAPEGEDKYDIFLFKGGVNCKHWWQRVVFLKKDNKRISVNKARKMILELEPEDRKEAKWEQNPKEVAKPAEKKNNWWSLKPNYRDSGVIPIKK